MIHLSFEIIHPAMDILVAGPERNPIVEQPTVSVGLLTVFRKPRSNHNLSTVMPRSGLLFQGQQIPQNYVMGQSLVF